MTVVQYVIISTIAVFCAWECCGLFMCIGTYSFLRHRQWYNPKTGERRIMEAKKDIHHHIARIVCLVFALLILIGGILL